MPVSMLGTQIRVFWRPSRIVWTWMSWPEGSHEGGCLHAVRRA